MNESEYMRYGQCHFIYHSYQFDKEHKNQRST